LTYNKKIDTQQHQKTILDNGLTILSLKNTGVESVAVEAWVKVGSRYEAADINGIAHFIEHMNFKGTHKRSSKQIAEEFDAIGGYLNAFTSKEHTVYSAKILAEFLEQAVDMLADIMFNSLYNDEDIEKEKNVVLQELAQTKDTPDDFVFENFYLDSFAQQALGRSILGTEQNIQGFTKEAIIDFVKKYYVAPNIIVAASGNIEHEEFVNLVQQKFNPFEGKEQISIEATKFTGGYSFTQDNELSQYHLIIGYEGVAIGSKDYYKLEMLSNIFGGSISSRLFQEIREKRGLVYSVGTFSQYYRENGIFGISAATSPEKIVELVNVLAVEIKKIVESIDQSELDRCLAQVKSALLMGRETVDNWVSILASNYSYYNRYVSREDIWQEYASVRVEDLKDFASKIFSAKKPITVTALGSKQMLPLYDELHHMLTY
jgi:predicted Zn-dependent peptidase